MVNPITRENWHQAAKEVDIRLESIAVATGKSFAAVYRYSRGTRRPPDEWMREVEALIERARRETL